MPNCDCPAAKAGPKSDQTWSGTLRSSSLRFLAGMAASKGMRVHRWDFVSAYLQGSLEEGEVVYCHAPQGYERYDSDGHPLCCKIVKPVYGMAQAGRRWQRTLFPWLEEFGLRPCAHDPCLFRMTRATGDSDDAPKESLVVGVYVDDLACAFSSDSPGSLYADFTAALQKRFEVEDEGELSDLLGIDFSVDNGVVSLTQSNYIDKLVATFAPDGVPPTFQLNATPHVMALPTFVTEAMLQDADSIDPLLLHKYQRIVGALLYCATNTRPETAYSVGQLSRAMGRPTPVLYDSALRVVHYLHRTRDIGLRYEASSRPLHGYSDSDWAVRHSTSGRVFILNQAAISWGSKKQKSVALSSCEAEIVAASEASKEAEPLGHRCSLQSRASYSNETCRPAPLLRA